MNYFQVLSLNIFSALVSFGFPETFFQISLLILSVIMSALKCYEFWVNIEIKRKEAIKLKKETELK